MSAPAPQTASALSARRIKRSFGPLDVLRGVDIDLHAGQVTVLLGANGAGKSTLIRVLAGDLCADQGVVRVAGHDLDADPDAARRHLVYLAQSPPLAPFLTAREHAEAMIAFRERPRDEAMAELERCAHALAIGADLDRPVRALSGGMRQKAALSLAFATAAPLVMLDEPHAGLDIPSALAMRTLITTRRDAGTAFLVASHLAEAALAIADRALVLAKGLLVADLGPDELRAFGGDARAFEQTVLEAMAGSGMVSDGAAGAQERPTAAGEA